MASCTDSKFLPPTRSFRNAQPSKLSLLSHLWFSPSHSCYFYQQRGQQYYIRQRRHQKSSHSQGSTAVVKEPTYLNSIHLFMPTAERLVVFMNLVVTQYVFIAYIYRQALGVDLLKDLCNVSHTYNRIQRLCKYPKPSNSLKLLCHFLKSALKGTLSPFLTHERHNKCQNYFCSLLRKGSCPHSALVFVI